MAGEAWQSSNPWHDMGVGIDKRESRVCLEKNRRPAFFFFEEALLGGILVRPVRIIYDMSE